MKILKNNFGLIMFYVFMIFTLFIWCEYVEKNQSKMNEIKLVERSE